MKYLKDLFFDRTVVKALKSAKVDSNYLYSQLYSGKITLQEYLSAIK